jgi:hypothetical protein
MSQHQSWESRHPVLMRVAESHVDHHVFLMAGLTATRADRLRFIVQLNII